MKKYEELENRIKELQEEVERLKKKENESQLPDKFDREHAIEFLFGERNIYALSKAFDWDSTPEGDDYWAGIDRLYDDEEPIPDDAVAAIQRWIIISYHNQYGD